MMAVRESSYTVPATSHVPHLPHLLYGRARSPRGDAPAFVGTRTLTYRELDARADAFARGLRDAGVERDVRVALRLAPGPDYAALLWACVRLGAVACPLSPRLPDDGLRSALKRLQSRHLVTDDTDGVPTEAHVLKPKILREVGTASKAQAASIDADQPVTLLFTSGSTGSPRLALHSYGNHYFSAAGSARNLPLGSDDRWLLSLPLFHVGGLAILFRCAMAGAAVVVPGETLPETFARHRVTHVSLVPTQLQRLLRDAPPGSLDGLAAVLLGGGPIPGDLVREALERGVPLHTTYGLTEMSSQVTTTSPGADADVLTTAGRLLPHRQLALAADGEILVRGRTLFLGYVDGRDVHRPVDANGWFHTSDLGELSRDGCLRVVGRADNLFISGGENVQPEEIEQALAQLPGVREAVVVDVPDEQYGARPVAFVRTVGDVTPHTAEWRSALERELPRFKVPDAFHPWPSGNDAARLKPNRAALRRLAAELQRPEQ